MTLDETVLPDLPSPREGRVRIGTDKQVDLFAALGVNIAAVEMQTGLRRSRGEAGSLPVGELLFGLEAAVMRVGELSCPVVRRQFDSRIDDMEVGSADSGLGSLAQECLLSFAGSHCGDSRLRLHHVRPPRRRVNR